MADNLCYIGKFIDRIEIPSEAKEVILQTGKKFFSDETASDVFFRLKTDYMSGRVLLPDILAAIGRLSTEVNIPEYTLRYIFLVYCTDILLENYKKKNIDELIYWDTMDDLRCKLLECHDVMGIWGTFVQDWFDGIFKMTVFALGRFQYEEIPYAWEAYEKKGVLLKKGDKVYNIHIPSSGRPFDRAARIESYRRAYEFFGFKEKGGKQILVCRSWLLYKELERILPVNSRIVDFIHDFDIVASEEQENFNDSWRVFGRYHKLPLEQLPTDTTLRKAIVNHLSNGGKMGIGSGIIVFDGERIVNPND